MRLVAATIVVLYHFGFWHFTAVDDTLINHIAPSAAATFMSLSHFGWVGVEIFFVISGYVIAYSAHNTTPQRFAWGRVLRLLPGVWICAPIAFVVYYLVFGRPLDELVPSLIRTLTLFPLFSAIDGVYWTLGIEVSFYVMIFIMLRQGWGRFIGTFAAVLGVISLLFWLTYFVLTTAFPSGIIYDLSNKAGGFRPFQLLLVQHGCFFALGIMLKTWRDSGFEVRQLSPMILPMLACWMEIVAQNGIIERASLLRLSPVPALALWTGAFALCAASLFFNEHLVVMFRRHLGSIRRVGLMTYPLYLIHNPVGLAAIIFALSFTNIYLALALGIAMAFVAALIVSLGIEPAIQTALRNKMPNLFGANKPSAPQNERDKE
nr:acyltransferase [Asticcacaulis currens]